jgi:hypothetical protein
MKLTLKKQYHLQSLGVLLRNLDQEKKKNPTTLSHGEGRWGKSLRTTINESIVTKILTKKPHPSSLLEKICGAINYNK